MVSFSKALLTSSALLTANTIVAAKPLFEIDIGKTAKSWEWMWGNPPPTDYITSESHACSAAGNVFNNVNAAARHISSIQIFSHANAINGIRISHVGGFVAEHGLPTGRASEILHVPVDKWISTVKMGCTAGQVSYLSFTTTDDKSIEAGSAAKIIAWENFAAFNFLGSANDAGFVSFGVQFSEVKGHNDK